MSGQFDSPIKKRVESIAYFGLEVAANLAWFEIGKLVLGAIFIAIFFPKLYGVMWIMLKFLASMVGIVWMFLRGILG